jgi:hypothetical protein
MPAERLAKAFQSLSLSARFWPAPVELLDLRLEEDWRLVLTLLAASPANHRDAFEAVLAQELGARVLRSFGGYSALRDMWLKEGANRTRRAYQEAYRREALAWYTADETATKEEVVG